MRLFQLLASPLTTSSSSSYSSSSSTSSTLPTLLPPPSTPSDDEPTSSPPSSITVPFFSVAGFVECPWYRRAVCIADEFVRTQMEQSTGSSDAAVGPPHTSPPLHTRVQSVTLPRQLYRHYLLSLHQHIDLHDHYSCPIVLQGSCTLTGTPQQHAADYPLQHTSVDSRVTGSAVKCECRAEKLVGGYGEWERLLSEQYGFVATRCGRLAAGQAGGQC